MNNRLKPAKALWKITQDTWQQSKEAQLFITASSLAYTTILSIIPMLAVSFAIFKAFGGLEKVYQTIEPFILSNLAEGSSEEALKKLHDFIDNAHETTVGVGGLVALILTSMSMLSSVENAINRVWHTRTTRSIFQRVVSYWFFITLGPLGLAVALGVATSSKIPLSNLLPSGTGIFLLTVGIFFAVYKYVPNYRVNWAFALISATFTSVLWNLARVAYSLYTEHFVSYSRIYGSLAAVPILLLWIYIVWLIILTGAALTAALQKRLPSPVPTKND